MKKMIKRLLCLVLMISLILLILNPVLKEKRNEFPYNVSQKIKGFYEEPENSLDIVFVGASTMFSTMNPIVMWDEQGITSYDFAANEQNWYISYYYIKELLKYQTPKAIVLDTYYCAYDRIQRNSVVRINFDDIRFGGNKICAIWNNTALEDRLSTYIPVILYHDRWKSLSSEDFSFDYEPDSFKGWSPMFINDGFPENKNLWSEGMSTSIPEHAYGDDIPYCDLPEGSIQQLNEIVELCSKEGVELILLTTPNGNQISLPDESGEGFIETDGRGYYKSLEKWADEHGVTYVNMNAVMDGLYHNYAANACKASSWFGRWIKERLDIEDKRNNPDYEYWIKDSEKVHEYLDQF